MLLDSPRLAKLKLDVTLEALLKSVGSVASGTGTVLVKPLDSPLLAKLKLDDTLEALLKSAMASGGTLSAMSLDKMS